MRRPQQAVAAAPPPKLAKCPTRFHGLDTITGRGPSARPANADPRYRSGDRQSVTRHGGLVRADGKAGKSAAFWFTLPQAGADHA